MQLLRRERTAGIGLRLAAQRLGHRRHRRLPCIARRGRFRQKGKRAGRRAGDDCHDRRHRLPRSCPYPEAERVMDSDVLAVILLLLALSVALNLKLSLQLLKVVHHLSAAAKAASILPLGEALDAFSGKRLADGAPLTVGDDGQPAVLLFLSSACPKCRHKLPEIEHLAPLAREAGVALWLVSLEPGWRLRRFLQATTLEGSTVRVSGADYGMLNPLMSSPSYLFVSQAGTLDARGMIGDDDWRSFCEQMDEMPTAQEAGA
ncbi:redoxin domain-containing protein [Massilia sp. CCM 8692]|uniref:Redoxin domain-containing protein n=2 Tax=Massilia rubra TaxID=2607910 RepID=A0ABX0M010_9BURK|nr:redoxin domain-containing protein [Massilia rubra]